MSKQLIVLLAALIFAVPLAAGVGQLDTSIGIEGSAVVPFDLAELAPSDQAHAVAVDSADPG